MHSTTNMSEVEILKAQIQALKDRQKELRKAQADGRYQLGEGLSVQVSEKSGAVSVYGFGRFPVTLYKDQWERLFPAVSTLVKFINDNTAQITKLEAEAEQRKLAEAKKA